MTYNIDILSKWLDAGLCHGAGDGEQTVCLEQAVALCAGLPLKDNPDSCVDPAVSAFGRSLNDRAWSSPKARAAGLREFAFAQLGTAGKVDGRRFAKRVAEMAIRELVPFAFRKIAELPRLAGRRAALLAAAAKCETEGTEASAREANKIAYAAADAAAYAAAYYAAAYDDAAYAAYAAAYDAAAADAAADAAAYDARRSEYRDEMLTKCAYIGVRAIREQYDNGMAKKKG